jgi:ATP-dependent DNA helicase RecG
MTKEELLQHLSGIEWDDFEVKEAKDKLPENVWETVSAFSNTSGGWIVFGVAQHGKRFEVQGVNNGEKTESDFLNILRSGQKFNHKIYPKCKKYDINGKLVLAFFIESSKFKPIYFGNPINTYIRSGSGDRRADDSEIAAIMRDQSFGTRSEIPLDGTSTADIKDDSLSTYRQHIINFNPDFIYKELPNDEFCDAVGITVDGKLTYGSLLMFGKRKAVQYHVPNFWIDYIEIPGNSYNEAVARYTYRMPELDNLWDYYLALIQRLRLHVDAPFTAGPNGFSPDDNSQLYALREGLVNMEAHSDFFSSMHPTIRVYDNRFEFQNPGRFMRDMKTLRKVIKSNPRNPSIIKFFRYAKLGENAGYGINKMIGWEKLTGKKVTFESDIDSSTVTYYRPKPGERYGESTDPKLTPSTDPKLTPNTDPKSNGTNDVESKIMKTIYSTPNITKEEIAKVCNMTVSGVKYHMDKLKKRGLIEWQGHSRTGRWVILK